MLLKFRDRAAARKCSPAFVLVGFRWCWLLPGDLLNRGEFAERGWHGP